MEIDNGITQEMVNRELKYAYEVSELLYKINRNESTKHQKAIMQNQQEIIYVQQQIMQKQLEIVENRKKIN